MHPKLITEEQLAERLIYILHKVSNEVAILRVMAPLLEKGMQQMPASNLKSFLTSLEEILMVVSDLDISLQEHNVKIDAILEPFMGTK
jgi:hypothetical protein